MNYTDEKNNPIDVTQELSNKITNNLYNQFDKAIVKGLSLKGFKFDNKLELENFIKSNCRVEDNVELKERVYYVNKQPFFLHQYNTQINYDFESSDKVCKVVGELGKFAFL